MGKIRRFLGFLVFMCTIALGATSAVFAEEITLHWVPAYGDAPADTTCTYGETFDVPAGPTVTGRNFVSWTTNGQAFVPGQTGVDCNAEILGVFGGTVTFSGSFTPIHYTITYELNGGTNYGLNPDEYTIDSNTINLLPPTRANSTFGGWYDNPSFTGANVTTIPAGSVGNVTVYAKWTCRENYNDDDNDDVCSLNTYPVTYSCGSGATGTPPATNTAMYDTTFITANNTNCTKENWQFSGWQVSGTDDIKPAGKGFTWKYTEAKNLVAKWVQTPGNCGIGQYYDSGSCHSCPDNYTSDLGAEGIGSCYTTCQTACINPGRNVCNSAETFLGQCTFLNAQVDGIQYHGSSTCTTDKICNYGTAACLSGYYFTGDKNYYNENGERNTICISCSEATGDAYPTSVISKNTGIESCFVENTYNCNAAFNEPGFVPDKATCELEYETISGAVFYPNPITAGGEYVEPYPGYSCKTKNCVCDAGYTYVAGTPRVPAYCKPDVYTITLDDNGGSGGVGTIYAKFESGYMTTPNSTTMIEYPEKLSSLPTLANKVFYGYWDSPTGGQKIIDLEGNIPGYPYYRTFTENKTLYAHWVDELFDCTVGKSADGATCAQGYYCPGETVVKTERYDDVNGCQVKCPEHPDDDPVTSAAGSSNISACRSTTTGVDLDDNTGGGDKVCSYHWDELTSTGDFTTTCDPIIVKYCNADYYYDATIDPTTCIPVGEGYSSPDPNNTVSDPASMERQPNSYTITYNCGTGAGTAPTTNTSATYNASFTPAGVGDCSKVGHSFAGWKISGTETVVNSAFTWTYPANKTLTAQWSPNVYTITLSDGGDATTHGAPSTLYVKYGDGWYTDASATNPITSLIQTPTKSGYEFESYSLGGVEVINKNGVFLSNTFTTASTTLSVVWAAGKVNCAPGEYYTGTSSSCTPCEANYFCPGGQFTMYSNTVSGMTACPGGGLSAVGAGDNSLCYKVANTYVATYGSGTQDCYYNTANNSYSGGICNNNTITKCNAGYYFNASATSATTPDCVPVGPNFYSITDSMDRFACPPEHPYSYGDNTERIQDCYNTCTLAANAKEMNGLNYYDPNHTGSCTINLCLPGYHLNAGECKPCPANSYCDGTAGGNGDGSTSCATLGSGDAFTTWSNSSGGAAAVDATHCYAICADRAVTNGHAYPVEGKETVNYDNLCEFYGISTPQSGATRGNPCDVNQLALGVCVESACHSEFEMIGGVCTPCARDANALTYAPTGNCIVATCQNGYHPDGYSCADDVVSCTTSIPNATSAYSEWSTSAKSYGKCTVETCAMGYHPESNACVLDEQTCSVPNGVGTQTWDDTLNTWGPCIVTACDAGYIENDDDTPTQCVDCPNKYSAGGDVAVSSYVSGCEIASCMYQGEKYALENGECLPICTGTVDNPTYDIDMTGMKYWDSTHNKCVRTCLLPGYIKY